MKPTTYPRRQRAAGEIHKRPGEVDAATTYESAQDGHAIVAPGGAERVAAPALATAPQGAAAHEQGSAVPDLVESYLHAIGCTPLLSQAEEVALAQRVAQGDRESIEEDRHVCCLA